jgi:dUTP pyrophosphatase
MTKIQVRLTRLPHAADLALPDYQSAQASGLDLIAAMPAEAPIVIDPGRWASIPTGITLALPDGYEAQVRPRSGLAQRYGVTVLNTPGTVDSDYRGEIQVLLINFGGGPYTVRRGMRIAQLVIAPVTRVQLIETERLDETSRGAGGFGSTGVEESEEPAAHSSTRY